MGPEEQRPETWPERLRGFFQAAQDLFSTRAAVFREELGAKGEAMARAAVAFALAAALAWLALLLLTAWIAALLSRLFGGPIAGILATFVLYAAAAAAAALLGSKALSRVKPLEFPVTTEEIRKDWSALRFAASPEPPEPGIGESEDAVAEPPPHDDLEARFRAGSE